MSAIKLRSLDTFDDLYMTLDVESIPHTMQSWPAWWAVHEDGWPTAGEVDVIEMAAATEGSQVAFHASGCVADDVDGLGAWSEWIADWVPEPDRYDCDPTSGKNVAGCGYKSTGGAGRGPAFTAAKGGKYAYAWNATGLYVWFAPRAAAQQGALPDCEAPTSDEVRKKHPTSSPAH